MTLEKIKLFFSKKHIAIISIIIIFFLLLPLFLDSEKEGELKDYLEIVYYVAFIILTGLIVTYAKKTYLFQTDKSIELYCKIYVDSSSKYKHGYRFGIEIFNHALTVAHNVGVELDNTYITTIDFIKPNESYFFPLGTVEQTKAGNIITLDHTEERITPRNFNFNLSINGISYNHLVKADLLYAYKSEIEGSLSDVSNEIARSARSLCDSIEGNKLIHTKKF